MCMKCILLCGIYFIAMVKSLYLLLCLSIFIVVSVNYGYPQTVSFPNGTKTGINASAGNGLNHYTGSRRIAIPIWNCELQEFSFPVELVYLTTGIKVDQPASSVGLGWELSAGGAISRTVKGYPDDIMLPNNEQVGWLFTDQYLNTRVAQYVQDFPVFFPDRTLEQEGLQTIALDNLLGDGLSSNERVDSEPDVFSFDFCRISGGFVIDGSGKARMIGAENLRVEYTQDDVNQEIDSIMIVDDYGNKFIFTEKERTFETNTDNLQLPDPDPIAGNYAYHPPTHQEYTSKWHLSGIITYLQEAISFSYSPERFHLDEFPYRVYSGFTTNNPVSALTDLSINSFSVTSSI